MSKSVFHDRLYNVYVLDVLSLLCVDENFACLPPFKSKFDSLSPCDLYFQVVESYGHPVFVNSALKIQCHVVDNMVKKWL